MQRYIAFVALIVSGVASAEESLVDALLDSLGSAGAEAAAAATKSFDALAPEARNTLAPWLSAWIVSTRDEARRLGVNAIPSEIREALAGHVPTAILDRVRWRVDASSFSLQRSLFGLGYTPAVTVDDVILFADTGVAMDAKLWAHEIYHVIQYRNWGVAEFVERYLADYGAVEHEASEFRWQWMVDTDRVPGL